jgi:hypothetical protein
MGNLPLKRDSRFHQGIYKPTNKDKFIGENAIFRSGLELSFFKFCDSNPNVLKWGSECIVVPYIGIDGKNHKYYIDNYVVIKEGVITKKYLVEVKPFKQTQQPVKKKQKHSSFLYESVVFDQNSRKWASAREFAKKHGMEFIIITDKDLNR